MSQKRTAPTIRFLASKKQPRRANPSSLEELFFPGSDHILRHEEAVWRAVILQAITDAMSLSAKKSAEITRRESLSWLTSNSRDFRTVCEYAGYDPAYLYEQIQIRLIDHRSYLEDDPCPNIQAIIKQFDRLMIGSKNTSQKRKAEALS